MLFQHRRVQHRRRDNQIAGADRLSMPPSRQGDPGRQNGILLHSAVPGHRFFAPLVPTFVPIRKVRQTKRMVWETFSTGTSFSPFRHNKLRFV